ncbi:hypothetical protein [Streptomyces sioyaensis]|uniref:hypothetical protein n=1 Tax=Streptomyces sioyaensis TaxID=67364 RepID=UPI003F53F885
MLFGEVVQADGVEGGLRDAFRAIDERGDGRLLDQTRKRPDPSGGAGVQVRRQPHQAPSPVVAEVERVFQGLYQVFERLAFTVAGGQGSQSTREARAASCAPRTPENSAVPVTSMPAYTNVALMRSVRSFSRSALWAPVVVRGLSRWISSISTSRTPACV